MKPTFLVLLSFLFASVSVSQAKFVGSKNSDKYHYTTCTSAKRISPSNLVTFKSVDEATKAGYVACKVCKPPASGKTVAGEGKEAKEAVKKQAAQSVKKQTSERQQCAAITKTGTRCKRMAQAGSDYCWQHQR